MRRPELSKYRDRRGGVRRRDHRAERNSGRPRHPRLQRANNERDGRRCEDNADNDEAGDGSPVVSEVAGRGVVRSVQQDGRDEERESELWLNGERRDPGTNARSAPPSARNAGYGAPTRRARAARRTAARRKPTSASNWTMRRLHSINARMVNFEELVGCLSAESRRAFPSARL